MSVCFPCKDACFYILYVCVYMHFPSLSFPTYMHTHMYAHTHTHQHMHVNTCIQMYNTGFAGIRAHRESNLVTVIRISRLIIVTQGCPQGDADCDSIKDTDRAPPYTHACMDHVLTILHAYTYVACVHKYM